MLPFAETLVGPRTPYEALQFWVTDVVRGSLGLPPLMRIA